MTDDRSRVDLSRAQGAVLGNGNTQHNHHYYAPSGAPSHPPRRPPPPPRPPSLSRRAAWALATVTVLAGLGVCGYQAIVRIGDLVGGNPFNPPGQIVQDAAGAGPWTIEGYGYRYTVDKVARTTHEGNDFRPRNSITVTGYVTVTKGSRHASKDFQFRDQADNLLEGVPFQGAGTGDPPVNQRTKLVSVIWDTDPRASSLTITIHDLFWPAGQDLILRGVPVA